MDPNTPNTGTSFELPQPVGVDKQTDNSALLENPEKSTKTTEVLATELTNTSTPPPISVAPSATTPLAPSTGSTALPPTTTSSMPALADDVDLIEKEWVEKAKSIVAHTKDNPHLQNKELSKVKAEYIKKRYNKEVRVNEE